MKNKIKKFLVGTVAAFLLPTTTFALEEGPQYGAGEWDTLGNVYQYYDSQFQSSAVYYSGGGDFQACVSEVSTTGAEGVLEFWSDDPSGDRFIGWGTFKNNNCVIADVREYVDGENDKAEIYVKIGNVRPATWARVKYQD